MTDAELNELLAEVEQDFADLRKSEGSLSKASEEKAEDKKEEKEEKEESKEEAKEEKKDDEMKKDDSMDEEQMDKPEAPAMEEAPAEEPAMEAAPEMDAAPEAEAPAEEMPSEEPQADEPAMEGDEPALEDIYMSMDEDELAEHYEALKAAMAAKWSSEPDAEASQEDMQMAEDCMAKSEEEAKEEEQVEDSPELKKYVSDLEAAVERLIKAQSSGLPVRKSVTEIVSKPGSEQGEPELSKEELHKKALEITAKPLSKSERDMLNTFFIDGANAAAVAELVKTKA